ncbi:MAG: ATP-grasp domain-containing protein [Mangrovibacterium sp.]
MNKQPITIAVTGLNNIDSPGPGIPVVRGIRESTFFEPRIVGLAYENLEPGIYMHDLVDKTYMVPYPSDGSDALIERVLEVHRKEKIDVLIPNFDAELYAFIKSAEYLKKQGISTLLPTMGQFEERHKSNLPEFGEKYGVHIPRSMPVSTSRELEDAVKKYKFPVMIKGKYYDAYVANNVAQAESYFFKTSAKWGFPVIVQEYIEGTELNVVALGDGLGNTIGAVPMRKTYITDKGKAWGGITIDEPRLLDITHMIISQTKWRGGMELEIIKSGDNKMYIIEINPRIPAWVYLAVGAGQNQPEALVQLALGMKVEPFTHYDVGKMFIRYSYDMIIGMKEFEQLTMNGEL